MKPTTPTDQPTDQPTGQHDGRLERRYRRLLRLYPRARRDEIGEEMLGVLLDAAAPGQTQPNISEVAALLRSATAHRLRTGTDAFRTSGWSDAVAVLTVALPALLAVRTLRYALVLPQTWRYQRLTGIAYGASLAGWAAPTAWLVTTVLVLLRRNKLAGVSAAVAATLEVTHFLDLAHGPGLYRVQAHVPSLLIAVVAAALLLRPAAITRGLVLVPRRAVVGAPAAITLCYLGTASWYGVFADDLQLLGIAGLALAAALAWWQRRLLRSPAGRRLALTGAALFAAVVSADWFGEATRFRSVTRRDVVLQFVACALAASTVLLAGLAFAGALRRGRTWLSRSRAG